VARAPTPPVPHPEPASGPCCPRIPGPRAARVTRSCAGSATSCRVVLHHLLPSGRRPHQQMARLPTRAVAIPATPPRAAGRTASTAMPGASGAVTTAAAPWRGGGCLGGVPGGPGHVGAALPRLGCGAAALIADPVTAAGLVGRPAGGAPAGVPPAGLGG